MLKKIGAAQELAEIGGETLLDEAPDRLGAGVLGEVDAAQVVAVAAVAVLPGHYRVVAEAVEPGAEQGVAALDLVIEEAEREGAVHGLDPQRQAAQLDGERIEIDGVEAALHHVAAQHRLEAGFELGVVGAARDQLVDQALGAAGVAVAVVDAEQPHQGAGAVGGVGGDAAMVEQGGVEGVGEEAEGGEREGAGAAGGIADGERQDVFRGLGGPARGRRAGVGGAVGVGGGIVGEGAQGALHGGDGQAGAGVEAAGALAGAAPAHQVPLARQDHAGDQAAGGERQLALVSEAAFGSAASAPPAH